MEEQSNPASGGTPPPVFKSPITPPVPPRAVPPKVMAPLSTPVSPAVPAVPPPPQPRQVPVAAPKKVSVVPQSMPPKPEMTAPTEVVIRTMQDDLKDIKQGVTRPVPTQAVAGKSSPTPVASTPRTFPLPPATIDQKKQKVVLAPTVTRRRGRGLRVLVWLFVLLLVGGGGAAAWYFYFSSTPLFQGETIVADAGQVLPAEYQLLLQYQLGSVQNRTDLAAAWELTGTSATLSSLLEGDARLLLTDPAIKEFYYVVLEDTPHPYLVVPKTPETTRLIANGAEVRFIERDGWYIVHQLTTGAYETALGSGLLGGQGLPPLLRADATTEPLRLLVGPAALPELRKSSGGSAVFETGLLQDLALSGGYHVHSRSFSWTGTAKSLQLLSEVPVNQQMLALVPAVAPLVRLGADFEHDVNTWLSVGGGIDDNILSRPVVQQLFSQLSTPYAYFAYRGSGEAQNVGLIIELPQSLQGGSLTLGDTALEEAMPALIPLILTQRTVVPISFSNATYSGISMRYAKISGTPYALNYAITPTHILIATSKESMFALIDTVVGTTPAATSGDLLQPMLSDWGTLPVAQSVVFGMVSTPSLSQLLPTANPLSGFLFGLALQAGAPEAKAQLILQPISQPSTTSP